MNTSKYFGGVAGYAGGNITSCSNYGRVAGGMMQTGGIAGFAKSGITIAFCMNYGDISAYTHRVAGIIGELSISSTIDKCGDYGTVTGGTGGSGNFCGSITSVNYGTITNCISTATVKGTGSVGGLIGGNYSNAAVKVDNCLFIGTPLRFTSSGNVTNCYTNKTISGGTFVTTNQLEDGTVSWMMNTVNGSKSNSGIFSVENGLPKFSSKELSATYKVKVVCPDKSEVIKYSNNSGKVSLPFPTSKDQKNIQWKLDDGSEFNIFDSINEDMTITGSETDENVTDKDLFFYNNFEVLSSEFCEKLGLEKVQAAITEFEKLSEADKLELETEKEKLNCALDSFKHDVTKIATAEEFITAVNDSSVHSIELNNSFELSSNINITKNLDIKGNGHTITLNSCVLSANNSDLVLNNLKLVGKQKLLELNNCNLTIYENLFLNTNGLAASFADGSYTGEYGLIVTDSDSYISSNFELNDTKYMYKKNAESGFEYYLNPSIEIAANKAVNIVVPAAENSGLSYDIYPVFVTPDANFFFPANADITSVVYYTVDEDGNHLEKFTQDFTKNDENKLVSLSTGNYCVKSCKSTLPTMYLQLDEQYGTVSEMNTSLYHDTTCYGDFVLNVPQELMTKNGWQAQYKSKNDDKSDVPGSMSIRGRGNSSWGVQPAKKRSYQIKSEKKVNLLEMGSAKKWVLVANDTTLVKNKLGLDISKELGIKYSADSAFVDVYINGAYMGVYMLSEKVEINSERINITDMDDAIEESGVDNVDTTGGYFLEIDNAPDGLYFTTQNNKISIKSPETLDTAANANTKYKYIIDKTSDLFNAIYNNADGKMSDDTTFMDNIDIESFVKYYWHQEFIRNIDCGKGSTYLFKDIDDVDQTFHAGPVWDSDAVTFQWYSNSWLMPTHVNAAGYPVLYNKLLKHKEFVSYVLWYYEHSNIKDAFAKAESIMDGYVNDLSVSGQMNSLRWNKNQKFDVSSYGKILTSRAKWIDEHYNELAGLATMGEFIDIPDPSTPVENKAILSQYSYSGGTIGAEIVDTSDNMYTTTNGIKANSTKLYGSVNGTTYSKFVYSDSAYVNGDQAASVPVMEASASQTWGVAPYFEIATNSVGYKNLTFSAKLGGSKKGPKNFKLQYSLNGTDFTDVQGAVYSISKNKTAETAFDNVALPVDTDNVSALYLRVIATDAATISGGLRTSDPSGGETAITDVIIKGVSTGAVTTLSKPVCDTADGKITTSQKIKLSSDNANGDIMYTVSDGTNTTTAKKYTDSFAPFKEISGDEITVEAWVVNDAQSSDKIKCAYTNAGDVISSFDSTKWKSVYNGKMAQSDGLYNNSYISASLDGNNMYIPLFDVKGFALSPDDGDLWQENGYWQFELPTAGFKDILLSLNAASTNKGPASMTLQYSTDGKNFINIEQNKKLPVTNMASYYDYYKLPDSVNNLQKVWIRFVIKEDVRASGTTDPLFNNESKGNTYIDKIMFTGKRISDTLLMPYAENTSNKFTNGDVLKYTSPEGKNIKYSISCNNIDIVTDAEYNDGINISEYLSSGNNLKVTTWCTDGTITSISNENIYYYKGNNVVGFNYSDDSKIDNINNFAEATSGTGQLCMYPDGEHKAVLTFDSDDGITAEATTDLYWLKGLACWNIKVTTKDYEKLTLSAAQRSGDSGPRDYKLQYSFDGINYVDVDNSRVRTDKELRTVYNDFELPDELDNKDNVFLRIIVSGGEAVSGNELDDPSVVGKGKTSINDIEIFGHSISNVEPIRNVDISKENHYIKTTIWNTSSETITPTVVFATYKNNKIKDIIVRDISQINAGESSDELNADLIDNDFDNVKIFVFKSYNNLVPFCNNFESK